MLKLGTNNLKARFGLSADQIAESLHALIEIGMVLFVITLIINVLSRALIWSLGRRRKPWRATRPSAVPEAT